jgi:hypothetical protein
MAAATTGFSDPLPDAVKKADALIDAISTAPTPEDRAKRVTELTRFFPQAIFHVTQAAQLTGDATLKAALQKAIDGHPGIARALPSVKAQKLHEDNEYLFDIFEHVPLLKDAARAWPCCWEKTTATTSKRGKSPSSARIKPISDYLFVMRPVGGF